MKQYFLKFTMLTLVLVASMVIYGQAVFAYNNSIYIHVDKFNLDFEETPAHLDDLLTGYTFHFNVTTPYPNSTIEMRIYTSTYSSNYWQYARYTTDSSGRLTTGTYTTPSGITWLNAYFTKLGNSVVSADATDAIPVIASDTTAPSISASPSSGTVNGGSTVSLSFTDNETMAPTMQYKWDSNSYTSVPYSSGHAWYYNSANVTVPTTAGSHTLTVTATNYESRTTTQTYSYTVSSSSGGGSSGAPTLTLSASPTSITSGGSSTLTLSSNIDVGPTSYYLRIYDSTAGTYLTNTGSGTTSTTTVTLTSNHSYIGRSVDSSGTIYSSSNTVTVSVAASGGSSGVPTLTLGASSTSIASGGSSTLTLSSSIDVGPTAYYLRIYDSTAGAYLTNTGSGTTSTTTVTLTSSHSYVGRSVDSSGTIYSSSNTVTVSVAAPADTTVPTVSFSPISGSSIRSTSSVIVTASDPDDPVTTLYYSWDGASYTSVSGSSLTLTPPSSAGSHILGVTAVDSHGNSGGTTANYTVTLPDTTAPTVSFSPASGSSNINTNSTITITYSDADDAVSTKQYNWDNGAWQTYTSPVIPPSTGTHTLYARGTDSNGNTTNPTASASYSVSTPTVAVTGVTLSPTTLSLTVGQNSTLTKTISPSNATNQAVTWTSSNTSVATVDSTGKVAAVAAGTATITVTTTDGAKTATCAVTVTAASGSTQSPIIAVPIGASVNIYVLGEITSASTVTWDVPGQSPVTKGTVTPQSGQGYTIVTVTFDTVGPKYGTIGTSGVNINVLAVNPPTSTTTSQVTFQ